MDKAVIVQFAKSKGYYDVIYNGKWRSYDVYEPVFQGNEVHYVGPPLTILVKGDEIRMSTVEEAFEILDEMETEEEMTIDKGHDIPVYSPVCSYCRHLGDKPRVCKAFPDGIPLRIWLGDHKHKTPFPGDQGITFERRKQ